MATIKSYSDKPKRKPYFKHNIVYCKKGDVVITYPNVLAAETATGIYSDRIYKCCNGKKGFTGGFAWSYTPFEEYPDDGRTWKDVEGYENLYQVSTDGLVRTSHKGLWEILSAGKTKHGYYNVLLHKDGKRKNERVHRLVAKAFIPNPNNYPFINHKDEDKANNCAENLEWCTAKYNINYGTANKRRGATSRLNPLKPRKPILQLSLSGEVVGEYNSTNEAFEKTDIDRRQISDVINHRKRQACGFFWVLKDDYDPNIDYPTKYKRYATRHREQDGSLNPNAKPIAQYTKDGVFVKSWGCIMDAKRALNIDYTTIWRCLHGVRKLGKGYIWKYL